MPQPPTTGDRPASPVYAELVAIGDELLAGDIINRNAAFLARRCRGLGIVATRGVVVRDRIEEIVRAIRESAERAAVVLCCGGLGPTTDDLTTVAVAAAADVSLERNTGAEARLRAKFKAFGRPMPAANLKQADFPTGAEILANPLGSAEGFAVGVGGAQVFVTPGVPREMERMMIEEIEPRLRSIHQLRPVERRIYRLFGMGESGVAERVESLVADARAQDPALGGVFVHYRASMSEVTVLLEGLPDAHGRAADREALCRFDPILAKALAPALYGRGELSLPARIVAMLRNASARLCTAESCTGGNVAGLLTAVAGASDAFNGGIIAYDDRIKETHLAVSSALLAEHGAVSEPVARAMAEGARAAMGSDLSVAITGIAGPGGGTAEKPVGTVYFAVCDAQRTSAMHLQLRGDRGTVQRSAAMWALKLVWDRLVATGLAHIDDDPPG